MQREHLKRADLTRVPKRDTGAEGLVVAGKPTKVGGAKEARQPAPDIGQLATGGAGERGKAVYDFEAGGVEGVSAGEVEWGSGRCGCGVDRGLRAGSEGESLSALESHGVGDVLSAGGARGRDSKAGWGREEAGHSDRDRQDCPDGREELSGAEGGAELSRRLLRVSAGEVSGRCGRPGTGTLLEVRLGVGSGHPCLLRHSRSRTRHAGGAEVYRLSVGPSLCGAVAQRSGAAGGWHADSAAGRDPTGGRGKPAAREYFPASSVRHLGDADVSPGVVREVRGRYSRALSDPGGSRTGSAGGAGAARAVQVGVTSQQDQDRVLQGLASTRELPGRQFRVLELHVPATTGAEPTRGILRQLQSGDQPESGEEDPPGDAQVVVLTTSYRQGSD